MPRGRRDANERAIIEALRAAGCDVLQLEDPDNEGIPDLLVMHAGFPLKLLEVKTATGKLSVAQIEFHRRWWPHVAVVRSPEAALEAMGLVYVGIDVHARSVAQSGRVRHSG